MCCIRNKISYCKHYFNHLVFHIHILLLHSSFLNHIQNSTHIQLSSQVDMELNMDSEIFKHLEELFKDDLRGVILAYKINEPRDTRDDFSDSNATHNMVCSLKESIPNDEQLRYNYNRLRNIIQQQGDSILMCPRKMLSIEIVSNEETLDFGCVILKRVSVQKATRQPYSLTHLSAMKVIENFDQYDINKLGVAQKICRKSEALKNLSFRCGPDNSRRAYDLPTILKNLFFWHLDQSIQSIAYYDNLKINMKPFCSTCNGLEEFSQLVNVMDDNKCTCALCKFLLDVYFTVIYEVDGHFTSC